MSAVICHFLGRNMGFIQEGQGLASKLELCVPAAFFESFSSHIQDTIKDLDMFVRSVKNCSIVNLNAEVQSESRMANVI